jgi:hypothetical protein
MKPGGRWIVRGPPASFFFQPQNVARCGCWVASETLRGIPVASEPMASQRAP